MKLPLAMTRWLRGERSRSWLSRALRKSDYRAVSPRCAVQELYYVNAYRMPRVGLNTHRRERRDTWADAGDTFAYVVLLEFSARPT